MSIGQVVTLGSIMPSSPPQHLVRYHYTYTKGADGKEQAGAAATQDSAYSGDVEVVVDGGTVYYRECREGREYQEVLYDRTEHHVLLFNHPQNRLNVFRDLPYGAARFIPFPFLDEEIARIVHMDTAKNRPVSSGSREISQAGTLGESAHLVPVQFQATLTNTPAGPEVGKFAIRAPGGDVAEWAFTYPVDGGEHKLPTVITRMVASPIMTEEEKQRFLRHEPVPPTHWRPDAQIRYTFVEDRQAQAGNAPSEASLIGSANEQTTIVDRRDLKNPISFLYRKEGGDLEAQIQTARMQSPLSGGSATPDNAARIVGCLLLAPLLLGAGWIVRRRIVRPAKA